MDQVEKNIHRWGCAASEAILDAPFEFFRVPNLSGFIGYRVESGCAIVFGDPVCPPEQSTALAESFSQFCNQQNVNIIFIMTGEKFTKWAMENMCNVKLRIGNELIFNPQEDIMKGSKAYKLRNKINHARSEDLVVKEYIKHDLQIEESLLEVGKKWLKGRRGPQVFIGDLDFFKTKDNKRWFYVKQNDAYVALALLSKLEAQDGWLVKYSMGIPEAPRGTTEFLIASILEILKNENCRFLTLGMVPSNQIDEMKGLDRISAWMAPKVYMIVKWLFNLGSRQIYWEQFRPKKAPSYVLFKNSYIGYKEMKALTKALKITF